jgi:hypothetical protein
MSRSTTATLNHQLTHFAVGKWNDAMAQEAMRIAQRFLPTVQVPGATGQFKEFNDINAFQVYNTARAIGGDPTRIGFEASDNTYSCKPHALEVTVDEWERKQVGDSGGAVGQQLLDEGKVGVLVSAAARSHAKDAIDFVNNNTTAVADRGNWSNANIDPIDQIDEQLDELSKAVGSTANIMIDMDVTAWRGLRSNPKVKARVNANQVTPITKEQFIASLLFPVDLMVSNLVYHTTKLGQASQTKARVMPSRMFIHFSVPNPTVFDPSFAKNFSVGMGSPIAGVRSWQDNRGLYGGHFVDWSRDFKVTSSTAIRRFEIT